MQALMSVVAGYLLGSVSFSYLLVRLLERRDIRTVGSGNAGATNVLRVAGKGPALATLALDVAKGVASVLLARALEQPALVVAASGAAAVLGHMFPLFFAFRGGKGVATAAGVLGTLAPLAVAISLVAFVVVVGATRYVSLGSIIVAVLCPLIIVALGASGRLHGDWQQLAFGAAGIGLLVVVAHRANIARLLAGEENRLGERKESTEPDGRAP